MKKCVRCGDEDVRPHDGMPTLLCAKCRVVRNAQDKGVSRQAKAHKKDRCEHCGFIAMHSCQLDVDHVDGDRDNDAPANLQTLCANCHRLKTFLSKDHVRWLDSEPEPKPQLKLFSV